LSEAVWKVEPKDRRPGPATSGMVREEAIAAGGVWAGLVRTAPDSSSGWHHHGSHETAIYVLSGVLVMEFGSEGLDRLEGVAGDFVFVPPGTIHRESNPSGDEGELIVVRSGSGEAVFNVEGPEGPDRV
jgi:uncharacterized RmlC-like cupin family protein